MACLVYRRAFQEQCNCRERSENEAALPRLGRPHHKRLSQQNIIPCLLLLMLLLLRRVHTEHIRVDELLIHAKRPSPLALANHDLLPRRRRRPVLTFAHIRIIRSVVIVAIGVVAIVSVPTRPCAGYDGLLKVLEELRRRLHHIVVSVATVASIPIVIPARALVELHHEVILILQALQTTMAGEVLDIEGVKAHGKIRRLFARLPLFLRNFGLSLLGLSVCDRLLVGLTGVRQAVQPLHGPLGILMKVPGWQESD